MGWNGSNSTNVYSKQTTRTVHASPRRTIPKIVIYICVCVIASFFVLHFFGYFEKVEKTESTKQPQKVKTIKATPKKSVKARAASTKKEVVVPKITKTKPTKIGEVVDGYIMLADKTLHKIKPGATNTTISIKGRYAIFQHRCDNELAGILCAKPGSIVVGDPAYNKWFTKAFIESLKTPIIIKDGDDEYTRNLKREIIETKADLKAAYDRGEDIAQMMTDARKELKSLMEYKRAVNSEIIKVKNDVSASEQEVEDFVNAANKLLEEKGIAPLHVGPISRRRLNLERKQLLMKGN